MTNLSITAKNEIAFTLTRWAKESAMHFCRLARQGATFSNVVYPTGLKAVIAQVGAEKAEVALITAKQLRAAGYKVVA
jgi:hypothetical protein